MRIEYLQNDSADRAVLRAERSAEDRALPVDTLIFDAAPAHLSSDQIAVAGVLLFAEFAERDIAFSAPITVELQRAIADATGLAVVSTVLPLVEASDAKEPDARPPSVTTMTVTFGAPLCDTTPRVDRTRLDLVPGERFQGALYGVKELVVASNAWYVATAIDPRAVLAAAGVLFAGDLLAKEIVLGDAAQRLWPTPGARALCEAVGLTLS